MTDKKSDEVESAEPQPDSPSEKETPSSKPEKADSKVVEKPVDEVEAEWKDLSGKTQDRVVSLVREKNKLKAELERAKVQPVGNLTPQEPIQPTADKAPSKTEVEEAVKKLKEFGVVTKDDLQAVQDRNFLDREHDRLGSKYSGSKGLPKYVNEEVEDYARSHYFGGNLEAAYRDMYYDELVDADVQKRGGKAKTYTEKPTVSVKVGEKPLTRESLQARLRKPDGAEWWAKNKAKIQPLMAKLSVKS